MKKTLTPVSRPVRIDKIDKSEPLAGKFL